MGRERGLAFVLDGTGDENHLRRLAAGLADHGADAVDTLGHVSIVRTPPRTRNPRQCADHPQADPLGDFLGDAESVPEIFKEHNSAAAEYKACERREA